MGGKRIIQFGIGCGIVLMGVILWLLGQYGQTESPWMDTTKRIAVISPLTTHPYWQALGEHLMAQGESSGYHVQITGPTTMDLEAQCFALETAVAAQVDGIITQGVDTAAFEHALLTAEQAGIPVVLVDADATGHSEISYVGSDQWIAGQMAGEAMVAATDGQCKIIVISGIVEQTSLSQRLEGFQAAIADYPHMEILAVEYSGINSMTATQLTTDLLKWYPDATGILGLSATDIHGAAKAMEKRSNASAYTLVGFDDLEYTLQSVENGSVYGTVVQDTAQMAQSAMELLSNQMNGEDEVLKLYTPVILVTQDNVADYLPAQGGEAP